MQVIARKPSESCMRYRIEFAGIISKRAQPLTSTLLTLVLINKRMQHELEKNTNNIDPRLSDFNHCEKFIRTGDALYPEEKLHFFVTAHFGKSKQINVHKCCAHFRNRLDRVIFRRPGLRLYKALWLEEGAQLRTRKGDSTHAHWLIEWPINLSDKAFQSVFSELWSEVCWNRDIRFKYVEVTAGGTLGVATYCLKEVTSGNAGVFIEACSDNARYQKDRVAINQY